MKQLTLTITIVALLAYKNFVTGQLYHAPPTGSINVFVDQDFPDFLAFSTFIVDDVTFTEDVTIGAVRGYYTLDTNGDGVTWPPDNMGVPFTAILNIFPDDGALDTEDPLRGTVVNIEVDSDDLDGDRFIAVTACGLNLDLAAGTYWIGLTPTIEFGMFGQELHPNADTMFGSEAFARNPGGAFGFGVDWLSMSEFFGVGHFDIAMAIYEVGDVSAVCCNLTRGDVNQDGAVDLLDVGPFVDAISQGVYVCEADINQDGFVDTQDVQPFVDLLSGG